MLSRADNRGHRSAVIGVGDDDRRVVWLHVERMHEIGMQAVFAGWYALQSAGGRAGPAACSSPCAECDRRRSGLIATTSPAIQPRPAVTSCSRPRVGHQLHADANSKKRASAAAITASKAPRSCLDVRSSPRLQSAKAPTPGSTIRSARATTSGSEVTTTGSLHAGLAAGALKRLLRRVQVARIHNR